MKSNIRGRFKKEADASVQRYTASVDYDWRLAVVDILGSIAHVQMLAKQDIITVAESKQIMDALKEIQDEIEHDDFKFKLELEDVHMNIEARLVEKIGDVGRKLQTARSRNDQVATDTRMFVMTAIAVGIGGIRQLQNALVNLADANDDVIMPGYTHLQRAQPVLLAHHLLAYFEMFDRDISRFYDCMKRVGVLPLGSGALAGVAYKIDREFLSKQLGFKEISQNSIDAVSDRDFVLEYEFAASTCMMHISRLAEEIVLWSTAEFDFIELDDAYTTGSSIMPQKKNPDVAELARGKTGRVYGNLFALLTTMKGLPLAYNRDMQEDKEGLFSTISTLLTTLEVFEGMLSTVRFKTERLNAATNAGYLLATDVADYLAKKGVAFRSAHEITGKIIQYAIEQGKPLSGLTLAEYHKFSPVFERDVLGITLESSIAARDNLGGTSLEQVAQQIARARKMLEEVDDDD